MASSLTETKAMLIVANRLLQDVEARLLDAAPSHTNTVDQWLAAGVREAQDECSTLIEKVRGIITQLG